jgi:dTDP-4-amino-4,6-dideoxygalactose transaminase
VSETTPSVSRLESKLSRMIGKEHCLLTARGASAIYLALRALPARQGQVVLPATLCPSPASAVLYAGFEPIFCDISLDDYNLDPPALERTLEANPDVVAVLVPHLYGHPAQMQAIAKIVKKRAITVIEDVAQALGAELDGKMLGSFGDISILSFGHTKILDAGGGGALLTDDSRIADRVRGLRQELPAPSPQLQQLGQDYRQLYYSISAFAERDPRFHDLFLPFPGIFRDLYLHRYDESRDQAILEGLERLPEWIALRRQRASEYSKLLRHRSIRLPSPSPGSVPWRFTFLVDHQKEITARLREAGIDVSNWYPPLHRWYPSGRAQGAGLFPHAEQLARDVVNLWVDPTTKVDVEKASNIILDILETRSRG